MNEVILEEKPEVIEIVQTMLDAKVEMDGYTIYRNDIN